jgi:transposase
MDYIGIDVHKKESQICILTEGAEPVEERIRTARERFVQVLGGRSMARVLLEASTESEWVARCLEELGHEVVVADTNFAAMYANRSRRVKTDRRDARTLAEACRLGAYREAHRTSDARRHLRAQVAVRESLVRSRSRFISIVGALIRREGFRIRSGVAETFRRRVEEVHLPDHISAEIIPLMTAIACLDEQILMVDRQLEASVRLDESAARLCTMPSVGPVTACAFVAAIDDPLRFRSAHQVEAYLGLVPSEKSSGEKQFRGRITKAGNTRVRYLLVQLALSTLRLKKPGTAAIRKWAEGIELRRGKRVAMVALARRLAGVLYAMMRDGTPYDPFRTMLRPATAS